MFTQQRDLAEHLQRSLLGEPAQPDRMEVVVRCQPAAHEAQVGGDWYDAFQQPDGTTVVVIGDVVGHDTASAAAMGQVRSLLRGIGYTTGAAPAGILTRVDEAIRGLRVDRTGRPRERSPDPAALVDRRAPAAAASLARRQDRGPGWQRVTAGD